MMDGRVKTLHPIIHGGLLALRDKPDHADGDEGARHRGHRSLGLQSLSLRSHGRQRRRLRGDHREYRHRRPGDDRVRRRRTTIGSPSSSIRRITPRVLAELDATKVPPRSKLRRKLAQAAYARTAAYDAAVSNWFAGELAKDGEKSPAASPRAGGEIAPVPALRRKSASGSGILCHGRTALRRLHGGASSGQGTLLQQHQRHRCGLRIGCRVRCPNHRGLRHHQTRQSLRRRARRGRWPRPMRKRSPPIRLSAYGGIVAFNRTLDGVTRARKLPRFSPK